MKEKLFEEARKLYQKFVDEKYPDISSKYLNEFYLIAYSRMIEKRWKRIWQTLITNKK